MRNTKKVITGLLFAVTLAVSLLASGGGANARVKGDSSHINNSGGDIISNTLPTPAAETFGTLGITWE